MAAWVQPAAPDVARKQCYLGKKLLCRDYYAWLYNCSLCPPPLENHLSLRVIAMKILQLLVVPLAFVALTKVGYGLGMEHFGPVDGDKSHARQSDWPHGMVDIVGHKSRMYSRWVNGSENFHFKATSEEMGELIHLYSEARLREHILTIKDGKGAARTFDGEQIDCNVSYFFSGGITRFAARHRTKEALTCEPTLTIYVDASADVEWWKEMSIPANVIVNSEVTNWPVKNDLTIPKRQLWHARVMFDATHPAADFKNRVLTKVTLWQDDDETGIDVGKIGHMGQFSIALSENEITDLRAGKTWLTLTVGGHQTAASKDDPKLEIFNMSPDESGAKTLVISRSKSSKTGFGR